MENPLRTVIRIYPWMVSGFDFFGSIYTHTHTYMACCMHLCTYPYMYPHALISNYATRIIAIMPQLCQMVKLLDLQYVRTIIHTKEGCISNWGHNPTQLFTTKVRAVQLQSKWTNIALPWGGLSDCPTTAGYCTCSTSTAMPMLESSLGQHQCEAVKLLKLGYAMKQFTFGPTLDTT